MVETLKVLRHCGWSRGVGLGDQVGGQIDRGLNRALKIERDDVLQVRIVAQLVGGRRRFLCDSVAATPQRFEFGLDYIPIHVCLLSERIRR
jgi:hypothetical protein